MFEGYHAECGGFVRRLGNRQAIQCAILHYEKIVELRVIFLERIQYLYEEGDLSNYVSICREERTESELILNELKSRL